MTLEPNDDFVLMRLEKAAEKTDTGIYLTVDVASRLIRATVVAVGPGKTLHDGKRVTPTAQVGDIVIVDRNAGEEYTVAGESHKFVRSDSIVAFERGEK